MSAPTFVLRAFDALSTRELYDVLALRQRVFVVEQKCFYLDADGKDPSALHLLCTRGERLIAYARILAPGVRFAEHAIGRVVVAPEERGSGLSRVLVREAIAAIERYGPVPIALSAQSHLEKLYESLGFARRGEPYEEDGIPHVDMLRPA